MNYVMLNKMNTSNLSKFAEKVFTYEFREYENYEQMLVYPGSRSIWRLLEDIHDNLGIREYTSFIFECAYDRIDLTCRYVIYNLFDGGLESFVYEDDYRERVISLVLDVYSGGAIPEDDIDLDSWYDIYSK